MNEDEYLHELIRQYKKATGKDKVKIDDEEFAKEFSNYVAEMNARRHDYVRLLHTLDVYTDDERTVEVGKGPFDSAVIDTKSTIVTPYKGMFKERKGKTFEGTHIIHNGEIYMLQNIDHKLYCEELDIEHGRVYMMHNMYHKMNSSHWYELVRDNHVLLGAYGRECDKDRDHKIKTIIERFDEIGDSYTNSGVVDGFYYYAQKSKDKILKKEKVLYRELDYGRVR